VWAFYCLSNAANAKVFERKETRLAISLKEKTETTPGHAKRENGRRVCDENIENSILAV
jgi:hypothetical protein